MLYRRVMFTHSQSALLAEVTAAVEDPAFKGISAEQALALFELPVAAVPRLFPLANALRERHKGHWVKLCGIVNAKSGRCPERCDFCAQSAHFETASPEYPLMTEDEIVARGLEAREKGVREFSIVTSGTSLEDEREVATVAGAIRRLTAEGIETCVSIGLASDKTMETLKAAGLVNFHHNLETAKSFHSEIVKSHTFDEELQTIVDAKAKGFQTCAGGIMGMGESKAQRVELAMTLRATGVSHIPVNFLSPIEGTPLHGKAIDEDRKLTPMECLRILAVYRLMMPDQDIFAMGGREVNLRELQSMVFFAGANGMMVGGYLTTSGRNHHTDLHMIRDLGLQVMACGGHVEHEAVAPALAAGAAAAATPRRASRPLQVLPS